MAVAWFFCFGSGATAKTFSQAIELRPDPRATSPLYLQLVEAIADAKHAEDLRKADEALMNSYASEEDLTRAYSQRLDLLSQTIDARQMEIAAREQSLTSLVTQAAEMERGGRPVSDAIKQMIASERTEIGK